MEQSGAEWSGVEWSSTPSFIHHQVDAVKLTPSTKAQAKEAWTVTASLTVRAKLILALRPTPIRESEAGLPRSSGSTPPTATAPNRPAPLTLLPLADPLTLLPPSNPSWISQTTFWGTSHHCVPTTSRVKSSQVESITVSESC